MKSDEPVSSRTEIILSPAPAVLPASLFAPTPKAAQRVLEFFATQINDAYNPSTSPRS